MFILPRLMVLCPLYPGDRVDRTAIIRRRFPITSRDLHGIAVCPMPRATDDCPLPCGNTLGNSDLPSTYLCPGRRREGWGSPRLCCAHRGVSFLASEASSMSFTNPPSRLLLAGIYINGHARRALHLPRLVLHCFPRTSPCCILALYEPVLTHATIHAVTPRASGSLPPLSISLLPRASPGQRPCPNTSTHIRPSCRRRDTSRRRSTAQVAPSAARQTRMRTGPRYPTLPRGGESRTALLSATTV